jgi:N-acetylglutamate synthase-like GNAT family acetyltransferase/predicted phosphodiesterase
MYRGMRYALISDIHANLPALQAVLADIQRRDVGATYHLGDLVGYAPWPNETVSLLREAQIAGIAGNYDSTVGTDYKHCGCKYEDPTQEEQSHLSFAWTKAHTAPEVKRYLAALPFRIDLKPLGGHSAGPTVILVHGTPTLNTLYWTEDRPDSFCLKMAQLAGAKAGDVIAFGHTHKPWHREIEGIHFVNTGSVGRPKDGDWRAGYVVLDMTGSVAVELVRVEYDVEAAMRAILASELPADFAEYLRTGGSPVTGVAGRSPATAGPVVVAPIRRATPDDWPRVAELLSASGLPLDGAKEHVTDFVVAERGAVLVGCAAVERYGPAGLLRSVAVTASERGKGTGAALVERCLTDARRSGIETMILLTTTADHYFPRFGFEVVDRAVVPEAVRESAEFRGACPASATVMQARLGTVGARE